jgi:hypothetical protein
MLNRGVAAPTIAEIARDPNLFIGFEFEFVYVAKVQRGPIKVPLSKALYDSLSVEEVFRGTPAQMRDAENIYEKGWTFTRGANNKAVVSRPQSQSSLRPRGMSRGPGRRFTAAPRSAEWARRATMLLKYVRFTGMKPRFPMDAQGNLIMSARTADRLGIEVGPDTSWEGAHHPEIAKEITRALGGAPVKMGDFKNDGSWWLGTDESIETRMSDRDFPCELRSPPMQAARAIAAMKTVFAWMSKNGHYTNESTGFHVNMSYRTGRKMDKLKLIMMVDEAAALRAFRRLGSEYAEAQRERISYIFGELLEPDNFPKGFATRHKEAFAELFANAAERQIAEYEKHMAINVSKRKYIEFRIMGGKDYHKKLRSVLTHMAEFGRAMKAAYDPRAYNDEYRQAIHQLTKLEAPRLVASRIDSRPVLETALIGRSPYDFT